jgi:hypothetical protein
VRRLFSFAAREDAMRDNVKLRRIKMLHTVIWAVMAGCIVALPWAARARFFVMALVLTAIVLGEFAVLAVNEGRCPLTDVAARYTEDRADNFDIYLPVWLARHNKRIFGVLFVVGEFLVLWQWTLHNP